MQSQPDKARAAFEHAVSLAPTAEHLHHLAMLLTQERHHAAAAATLQQAVARCTRPDERSLLELELGLAHMEAGEHAAAVDALTRASRALPDHAVVHHALGVSCSELARLPEAIAHLSRSLAVSPANVVTLRALAWAYAASGDHEAAAIEYEHAASLEPTDAGLLRLAGDERLRLGHIAQAQVRAWMCWVVGAGMWACRCGINCHECMVSVLLLSFFS
jgi:tetratricopeptide (TPR) repeat protein